MDPPAPFGAFLGWIHFYAPGTAEPSEFSPAELVVYGSELSDFFRWLRTRKRCTTDARKWHPQRTKEGVSSCTNGETVTAFGEIHLSKLAQAVRVVGVVVLVVGEADCDEGLSRQ